MDQNETLENHTPEQVELIVPEAVVDIPMSTGYYQKIQQLLTFLLEGKSTEEILKAHEQISAQNVTEPWVNHYETLLILCREFEQKAKDKGFTKMVTMTEAQELFGENQ